MPARTDLIEMDRDRPVELRGGERERGYLVYLSTEDTARYYRLKERTGKTLSELVSEGLELMERLI